MAVSTTANANATRVQVRNAATRIKKIEVYVRSASSARLYLQGFNTYTPTIGTTTADLVLMIPPGRATKQKKMAVVFASEEGGLYFSSAFAFAVTTTPGGSTNPATADQPQVKVHWVEG